MKTRNKQIERLRNKIKSKSSTPMKETEEELRGLSLTPKKKRKVKRKLMLGNALLSELRKSGLEMFHLGK